MTHTSRCPCERASIAVRMKRSSALGDQPETIFPEALESSARPGLLPHASTISPQGRTRSLEKTGLLRTPIPASWTRSVSRTLKASNASVGLMLENVSPRLMPRWMPHAKLRTNFRARLRTTKKPAHFPSPLHRHPHRHRETMEDAWTRSSAFERCTKNPAISRNPHP